MLSYLEDKLTLFISDERLNILLCIVGGILLAATLFGQIIKCTQNTPKKMAFIENFNSRVRSWWTMCFIFVLALLSGGMGSIILFMLMSFLALREFIAVVPTRRSDHRILLWCFWIILPVQYYWVFSNWYNMFVIFIPVYVFLFVPARNVIAGDCNDFLTRTAKIQWAIMACIYCISHAPMLLKLDLHLHDGGLANLRLLFFLVTVVEMSDVLQYIWGKLWGKHPIAPQVSPNKTVEGFIGGVLSATALGTALSLLMPFNCYWGAGISFAIAIAGFLGDLTMSAIKRDCGVKDYGTTLAGHGGILDRIDSLCFAAPIYFHIVRYFFTH